MRFKKIKNKKYIVVEDGMIGSVLIGEGRMIPGVVLKSTEGDTRLKELIDIHETRESGDVIIQWGMPLTGVFKKRTLILDIEFTHPMILRFGIYFDTYSEFPIIDAIIQSRGLHLSVGEKGERFSSKLHEGNVCTIEVPDTGFDQSWESLLYKILKRKYKKLKVPNKELKSTITKHIQEMRRFTGVNLRGSQ